MISEGEVSIQKNQGNFRVGVYQISRLNPQIRGLIAGATEFLVEMSLGRSIPRPIAKPVVAGHTRNDILATRAVVGDKSRSIRGEVKDIFLPRPEGEDDSLTFQPPLVGETRWCRGSFAWFHLGCILIE